MSLYGVFEALRGRDATVTIAGKDAAGIFAYTSTLDNLHDHPNFNTDEFVPMCLEFRRAWGPAGFDPVFRRMGAKGLGNGYRTHPDQSRGTIAIQIPGWDGRPLSFLALVRAHHFMEEGAVAFGAPRGGPPHYDAGRFSEEPTPADIERWGYKFAQAMLLDKYWASGSRHPFFEICAAVKRSGMLGVTAAERLQAGLADR